jgi:rhomboid protease GluP
MLEAPVGYHCPECVREARLPWSRRTRARVRLFRLGLASPGKVSTALVLVNAGVLLVDTFSGGALTRLGASFPPAIAAGEYWRLLTPVFLHAGLLHLALNSYALLVFGPGLEGILGPRWFAALYFLSGLTASATSYALSFRLAYSVGASGAVFGLLGAWVALHWRRRHLSRQAREGLSGLLVLVAVNVAFGFAVPAIDNLAHLGGLAGGLVAGLALDPGVRRRGWRWLGSLGVLAAVLLLVLLGDLRWK